MYGTKPDIPLCLQGVEVVLVSGALLWRLKQLSLSRSDPMGEASWELGEAHLARV